MTRRSPFLDIAKDYLPREPRLHQMFEYPELARANHRVYKEITMDIETGKSGYTSLDDVFVKAIKKIGVESRHVETFKEIYVTLQQAAPKLCQNVHLLAVAFDDIYRNGGSHILTMKHIAHCASVERTLVSSLTGYEYLGLGK
jgi:hypothetical protein